MADVNSCPSQPASYRCATRLRMIDAAQRVFIASGYAGAPDDRHRHQVAVAVTVHFTFHEGCFRGR